MIERLTERAREPEPVMVMLVDLLVVGDWLPDRVGLTERDRDVEKLPDTEALLDVVLDTDGDQL